jgi:hypothetical protein
MKNLFFVGCLLMPWTVLTAQEGPSIEPGTRVRLRAPSVLRSFKVIPWIKGSIVSLDADTLMVKSKVTGVWRIPHAAITEFEVSSQRSRGMTMLYGLGAGVRRSGGVTRPHAGGCRRFF